MNVEGIFSAEISAPLRHFKCGLTIIILEV